ncbi:MAG: SDR family NAD(P)-dependent oxidoreductase [Burkholderiales bacterium]
MKIAGSAFVVTGGASGLGEATVRRLHADGGSVVIADLDAARGSALAAELGSRAAFHRTDVASVPDAEGCVATAVTAFGGLHGLVNCAGIGVSARVLGKEGPQKLADFARVVTINLVGTFNMIRLAAAAMANNAPDDGGERGVVVNTASVAAYEGQVGQAAYAASKGGVVAMTLPIARELARFGIRVCTIAPGLFATPMMGTLPPDVQEALGKSVPFPPRLGRPDEFAALAAHIVGNAMLNGETIRLDGAIRLAPK